MVRLRADRAVGRRPPQSRTGDCRPEQDAAAQTSHQNKIIRHLNRGAFGMSKANVHLTVELTINEGKFDAFQAIAQTMIAGTQKEPGALGYEWHLSSDRKRCRLLETSADANAVFAHMNGPVVREL